MSKGALERLFLRESNRSLPNLIQENYFVHTSDSTDGNIRQYLNHRERRSLLITRSSYDRAVGCPPTHPLRNPNLPIDSSHYPEIACFDIVSKEWRLYVCKDNEGYIR